MIDAVDQLREGLERWACAGATFWSQRSFRTAVLLAEKQGLELLHYIGPGAIIVHPASVAWLGERQALGRMREHFGMLS